MKKLLSAAALTASSVAPVTGCHSGALEAETAMSSAPVTELRKPAEPRAAAQAHRDVITRVVTEVAEPMPSECGCTAGNSKRPRYEVSAACCEDPSATKVR